MLLACKSEQNLPYIAYLEVAIRLLQVWTAKVFCVFSAAHMIVLKPPLSPESDDFGVLSYHF